MSTLVRISSADRDEDLPHESAEQFSTELEVPYNVHATQLLSANIPNTHYNVSKGTFLFKILLVYPDNSTDEHIISGSIPIGHYDVNTLLSTFIDYANPAIAAAMVNDYPTINKTTSIFDDVTGRLTVSFDGPPSWYTSQAFSHVDFVFTNINPSENEVLHHLGWRDTPNYINTETPSLITTAYIPLLLPVMVQAPYTPELSYHRVIEIHCPELAETAPGNRSIIGEVLLDKEFGDVCFYKMLSDTAFLNEYASPRFINEISFSLRNAHGELFDNNNHDWSALIKVYYST